MTMERLPPQNIEAEQSVLGSLLIDPEAIVKVAAFLHREDFSREAHARIYSAILDLHEREEPADFVTLTDELQRRGHDVTISSAVSPEFREYERTATTVINAYVAPLMSRYLARLAAALAPRRLAIMQSNGGLMDAAAAGAQAARTALSGPAGGVVGAMYVAGKGDDLITFDMGGTSTDVALCAGRPPLTTAGEIAGLPLRLPLIDIHTVGAGGGSLAYLDAGGALQVGPQSAGAAPGPACYWADYSAWRAVVEGSRFQVPGSGESTLTLAPSS